MYDDVIKALLTYRENLQLERSGSLSSSWAPAVDQCLTGEYHEDLLYYYPDEISAGGYIEHYFNSQKIVPALQWSGDTKYTGQDHAVDATRLINNNPPGWDSPFFVAALGRCLVDHLGGEIHAKLLACISGAAPYIDRFIVQSAVTSLGHLYFDTGNAKISYRLLHLWLSHEVSNVRDHCVTSLKAIKHPTLVPLLLQLANPESIESVATAQAYYADCGIDTAPLVGTSLNNMRASLYTLHTTTGVLMTHTQHIHQLYPMRPHMHSICTRHARTHAHAHAYIHTQAFDDCILCSYDENASIIRAAIDMFYLW